MIPSVVFVPAAPLQITFPHFTLQQIFEKSWEYAKGVFTCFVDLEKAYDRVPCEKLWGVLRGYSRWPESLFQTPTPILFQNFKIRIRQFFDLRIRLLFRLRLQSQIQA